MDQVNTWEIFETNVMDWQKITMVVNVIGHSPLPKNCATCKYKQGVVYGEYKWMHGYISGAKNGV